MEIHDHAHAFGISVVINKPPGSLLQRVACNISPRAYRGLSGIMSEPAARSAPIMHCTDRGNLHDKSESMNEQK